MDSPTEDSGKKLQQLLRKRLQDNLPAKLSNDKPMHVIMFEYSREGNIKELEKLYNEGNKFTVFCGYIAAGNGDLTTLKWLYNHECEINTFTVHANIVGKIDKSEYGNSRLFFVDESYYIKFGNKKENTSGNFHCEILDWLKSISFRFNPYLLEKHASVHPLAAQWFINNGYMNK